MPVQTQTWLTKYPSQPPINPPGRKIPPLPLRRKQLHPRRPTPRRQKRQPPPCRRGTLFTPLLTSSLEKQS